MIQPNSFAEDHIRQLQRISKRDPILLERAVYAFGLLEALARVGMPFIFKGGTCLMLLMERPRRLSTDIDIIVRPGTDLDAFLEKASRIFPFQSVEEQKRVGKNQIEKRHFKFTYDSPVNHKPLYPPTRMLPPMSFKIPPTEMVGSVSAANRMSVIMDVVVVFPWVPETATDSL